MTEAIQLEATVSPQIPWDCLYPGPPRQGRSFGVSLVPGDLGSHALPIWVPPVLQQTLIGREPRR